MKLNGLNLQWNSSSARAYVKNVVRSSQDLCHVKSLLTLAGRGDVWLVPINVAGRPGQSTQQ